MAANTGERTLIPALIPPGAAHIHRVSSVGGPNLSTRDLAVVLGFMSSLVADLLVRAVPKSDILLSTIERLPLATDLMLLCDEIAIRAARLNCLSEAHAPFWESLVGESWTPQTPHRLAADRRRAQIELDALVALALDVSVDELCAIYRTQFPVLRGYDRNVYYFDEQGRLVPNAVLSAWRQRGTLSADERTVLHPFSGVTYVYQTPFAARDREAELRAAHGAFSQLAAKRRSNIS